MVLFKILWLAHPTKIVILTARNSCSVGYKISVSLHLHLYIYLHPHTTHLLTHTHTQHTHTHLSCSGTPDALTLCIGQICNIMLENPPRGPLIPYKPHALPNQAYQPRVNVSILLFLTRSISISLSLPPLTHILSLTHTHTHTVSYSPTYLTKLHTLLVSCPMKLCPMSCESNNFCFNLFSFSHSSWACDYHSADAHSQ